MSAGPAAAAAAAAAAEKDRSISRGRDFHSSGRGGAGNIRPSRDNTPVRASLDGPDDFSVTRGREPVSAHDLSKVISIGRGGAGNIRSPSRDTDADRAPPAQGPEYERDVIRSAERARAVRSSGRGGMGNITRSPSVSQSREGSRARPSLSRERARLSLSRERSVSQSRERYSTGRGGAGNIVPGDALAADVAELQDEAHVAHGAPAPALHSTGRGGAANVRAGASPGVEPPPHAQVHAHELEHEWESVGRGGAGNIRERSGSGERERERGPMGHGIKALLHRVGRSGSRPRGEGEQAGRREGE